MAAGKGKSAGGTYRYEMTVSPLKGRNWTDHEIAKYAPRGQRTPEGLPFALVRFRVQTAAAMRIMRANPGVSVWITWPVSDKRSKASEDELRPKGRRAG